ncbi:MAG: helix-turn-helix transcriptional regulator [Bacteroidota bacterium]
MNRIKEVLDGKGIKQTWLADKLGKSYNMVNSYVKNRQQPRLEVLYQIAEILEVEVKDLLIEKAMQVTENETKYLTKKNGKT